LNGDRIANSQAIIIAHQKTLKCMGKGEFWLKQYMAVWWLPVMVMLLSFHEALLTWYIGIWDSYKIGLYCIVVGGSFKLLIAGQELEVIAAPICAPLQVAVYWN